MKINEKARTVMARLYDQRLHSHDATTEERAKYQALLQRTQAATSTAELRRIWAEGNRNWASFDLLEVMASQHYRADVKAGLIARKPKNTGRRSGYDARRKR